MSLCRWLRSFRRPRTSPQLEDQASEQARELEKTTPAKVLVQIQLALSSTPMFKRIASRPQTSVAAADEPPQQVPERPWQCYKTLCKAMRRKNLAEAIVAPEQFCREWFDGIECQMAYTTPDGKLTFRAYDHMASDFTRVVHGLAATLEESARLYTMEFEHDGQVYEISMIHGRIQDIVAI